jgi:hypothetical protein
VSVINAAIDPFLWALKGAKIFDCLPLVFLFLRILDSKLRQFLLKLWEIGPSSSYFNFEF